MRRKFTIVAVFALVMTMALPALAITKGGAPDDSEHPYVGLMVALDVDGDPLWRCSGSLISPTVYVTAGHCVESPAVSATIWFDEDVESGIPGNGYPFVGDVNGTTYPHPDYNPGAFYLFDLGVVELDEPVDVPVYASLPYEGQLDDFGKGRNNAVVEAVGYGLQNANKNHTVAERVRMKADLFVVNTTGVAGLGPLFDLVEGSGSFVVSGDAAHGGTCFGDSGGPMLVGDSDTLIGVNSFGLNGNCAGVGGAYRIDQVDDLDFITSFLGN